MPEVIFNMYIYRYLISGVWMTLNRHHSIPHLTKMSDSGLTISGPRNPVAPPPDGETPITLYGYIPSLALGIVAVIAFSLVVIPNIWYLFKKRRGY